MLSWPDSGLKPAHLVAGKMTNVTYSSFAGFSIEKHFEMSLDRGVANNHIIIFRYSGGT